ncbi:3-phosphoserine/phosphohydroxythreonine transaminase [Kamptonema cortianum]|nr:3-phosphoserine/phosphohydroxythreonine transaminase [Geitlerinema splendidum]MDK3157643.1 3-phosphoserine/phosphohydroxythreonine transaminase [Kamptonema cortianum]
MSQPYNRLFNFSAGPGAIPVPVLEQARDEMLNWQKAGMSVMEMSHRGKAFMQIAEEAESAARQLMSIPQNYKILFLQGGASLQFTMLAMNFLKGGSADYLLTGAWGKKAVEAAGLEGGVNIIFDAKESGYNQAPAFSELNYSPDARYVHFTMNETIQGVDFCEDPSIGRDVICDMSSNIASRPFDVSKYAMVYAGAQKNLGPSGTCLVIIREDMLDRIPDGLPPMLDYRVQAENGWMYNTPPCWSVYMCGLVFRHWLSFGGLAEVEKHNQSKAGHIYRAIDQSGGFYKGHAVEKNRSMMNIPFTLPTEELTALFLDECKKHGFLELKGHRSVGGCRASVYNAFPEDGAIALAEFMADFAARNG